METYIQKYDNEVPKTFQPLNFSTFQLFIMNAFDYFFENTSGLEKPFLVGKEEITFKSLYAGLHQPCCMAAKQNRTKQAYLCPFTSIICSFLKAYLAIIKSGNICIPA